nr:PAS domain-containing protein [Burkholderia gladioli]
MNRIRNMPTAPRSNSAFLVQGVTDYAIFTLSPTGIVTSWNVGAERIKGYTHEEIVGCHFSRFYTAEDRAAGIPDGILAAATREGRAEREGWRLEGRQPFLGARRDACDPGRARRTGRLRQGHA